MRVGRGLLALVVVSLVGLALLIGIDAYTEWLWFQSVGYEGVFTTRLIAWWGLFAAGAGVFLTFVVINLVAARRVAGRFRQVSFIQEGVWLYLARLEAGAAARPANLLAIGIAVLLSIPFGLVVASHWQDVLALANSAPTGERDPLHGIDITFYLFALPLLRFAQDWFLVATLVTAVGIYAYYAIRAFGFNLTAGNEPLPLGPRGLLGVAGVRAHVLILAALAALSLAVGYQLDRFDLVYSARGAFYGAGYTDVAVVQPALWLTSALAAVVGASLVVLAFRSQLGWRPIGYAVGAWAAVAVLGLVVAPGAYHSLTVLPSELVLEQPYLERNIASTRRAYDLDSVAEQSFPADPLAVEQVTRNPLTISNIRLWDPRPLLDTYSQIQTIRTYYDFVDVDIDRYVVDDDYRQVMLAARELVPERLARQAQTWVNQRLQFTHGYGLAMSPVNDVTTTGLPTLIVKDVPPTGFLPITRPEIYYGELTTGYVVVRTSAPEFDYPKGDENVYSQYLSDSGIALDSAVRRFAFAWRLGDGNLVLTRYLKPESRLLFRREIASRARVIAPYLRFDRDPYLVIADGDLFWIHDAYTTSDRYPYSTPQRPGVNYIRNSVKVVTNAYDGSMRFFVVDPADPLIDAYARVYPDLYRPLDEMEPTLRAHLRYPEDMFQIQAEVYATYHVQDPRVFYNREDQWAIPQEIYDDETIQMLPYYVVMRLPDAESEEFLLMLPFTPANKANMIGWLAVRMDGDRYGEMLVYKMPKDKLVFGPRQIEARIDQDAEISSQFTLWSQAGSRIIRGNLLAIPIEQSLLYVEPVFLKSEEGQLPELTRIIVATAEGIAMEPTLEASLSSLFGVGATDGRPTAEPTPDGESTQVGVAGDPEIAALARAAQDHYTRSQEALRAGDWARYGEEQRALSEVLARLVGRLGDPTEAGPTPVEPTPPASP